MISWMDQRWKKEMKMLRGVRISRRPVLTMPTIWSTMIVSIMALSWPPALLSLLGKLIAEKSRMVLPSWRVEFVWLVDRWSALLVSRWFGTGRTHLVVCKRLRSFWHQGLNSLVRSTLRNTLLCIEHTIA